ncbi:uncharacterized protein B0T15DRAFT_553551 [Chaetomium strumarium]|uniref:DUF7582 domain-containing protein n=1 Tax=Chaetomium strumarium TaxID=1170767 RepID=A0AAJ0GW20_9PEZI|nr:hypothetical protein B0T15DRAFT_553551 [Chaetomium strumarium]
MCFGSGSDPDAQAPRRPRQQQRRGGGPPTIPLQNIRISGPVTPPGQVPAPQRDERGLWVKHAQYELSRQNIIKALGYAAQYISQKGQNVTVVAVGGAVNTVLLQTRNTTYDVDFLCPLLVQPTLGIVRETGKYAVERSSVPLAADWLNNATARMPGVVEHVDALQEEAVAQNDVLFSRPGLTVVAAPWNYAFIKKYIAKAHSNKPVPLVKIQRWGAKYKALCPVETLGPNNELYRRTYGVDGILFPASGGPGQGGSSRGGSSQARGSGARAKRGQAVRRGRAAARR